eukprot:TRINITY_DN1321_c0_g1_i2.p1 TRINITY_DN1321_c0_g1~~TRINITY_DN1321_c0_g1_i2.p1  ORF type:complete len:163 (+),score=1.37 TRINITY_DN1321_c0_g1_i2:310-798(+)
MPLRRPMHVATRAHAGMLHRSGHSSAIFIFLRCGSSMNLSKVLTALFTSVAILLPIPFADPVGRSSMRMPENSFTAVPEVPSLLEGELLYGTPRPITRLQCDGLFDSRRFNTHHPLVLVVTKVSHRLCLGHPRVPHNCIRKAFFFDDECPFLAMIHNSYFWG